MDLQNSDEIHTTSQIPAKSPAELHGGDGGDDDDDDDDVPTLSPYALEALKEFLATSQPPPSENSVAGEPSQAVALPKEDWRLSQFWYSPDTATTVADEVHSLLTSHFSGVDTSVACLACPTLFAYLKVSRWMSDKKLEHVTAMDAAVRLDLIGKAYGVKEAEKFFNGIPKNLRNSRAYSILLRCFAYAKCVEKAEAVMQKMKELGFASYSVPYNAMLNLHCRTHDRDKLAAVLLDMEADNINYDGYTYSILLNAYGGDGDIEKLENVLTKMESDPELNIDGMTYAVAAKHYIGAQLGEKALESLRKSEKLVNLSKKKNEAYTFILKLYADLGKKEEVLRVWEECKKCKTDNKDYGSVLRALLKFNDVKTAEKIFKEWEDSKLVKDIRIPNLLIDMYCENGVIEKAEALVEKLKSEKWQKPKWQKPDSYTWSWMTSGYVKSNMMDKAVEAMKSALTEPMTPICWKSKRENLLACLKYLKDKEDSEQLNAVIDTLKKKRLITADVLDKLVEYLSGKCDIEDVLEAGDEEETANNYK